MKGPGKPSKLRDDLSKSRGGLSSLNQAYGKGKSSKGRSGKGTSAKQEQQGPVDWSSTALKLKYRGEKQREDAWQLWSSSTSEAQKSLQESGMVLPVVKIDRHPYYVQFYRHISDENATSHTRTRSRLLMKRFVFDVQEVWLTNLQHLREHDPVQMYKEPGLVGGMSNENEDRNAENFGRGNGLHNRRDVRAIEKMDSQVQSVSQQRAFSRAYHTSRMPDIEVMLDYCPDPTPVLQGIKLLPPAIEPLIRDVRLCVPATAQGSGAVIPQINPPIKYPDLVYFLHIDRLLPSSDYQQQILPEVLWRFTMYRNDDTAGQVYIMRESDVAQYIAKTLTVSARSGNDSLNRNGIINTPRMMCAGNVFSTSEPVYVSFNVHEAEVAHAESSVEALIVFSVQVQGFVRHSATIPFFDCMIDYEQTERTASMVDGIKIEIVASIMSVGGADDISGERSVSIQVSAAELKHLLDAPTAPLNDIRWWLHKSRIDDFWPALSEHLFIRGEGDVLRLDLRYSADQRNERSSLGFGVSCVRPDHVEGALSTFEALSCASQLLEKLILIPQQLDDDELAMATRVVQHHELTASFTALGKGNGTRVDEPRPSDLAGMHSLLLDRLYQEDTTTLLLHIDRQHKIEPHFLYSNEEYDLSSIHAAEKDVRPKTPIVGYAPPQSPLLYFDNNVRIEESTIHRPPSRSQQYLYQSILPVRETNDAIDVLNVSDAFDDDQKLRVTDDVSKKLYTGYWEGVADTGSNSSLIASGALPNVTVVPGACEYGRRGLWFADHLSAPVEYTQAAVRFYRDSRLSSTNSILANMTLALDASILFPTLLAWEDFSSYPAPSPAEEVDGVVPMLSVDPVALRNEPVQSIIDERMSTTVMIFTSLPIEGVDHIPLDATPKPKGFCRDRPFINEKGYREQIEVTLLGVDPVLATMVFGITTTGAVTNNTGVNNRNIWHNTLAVTEHISRPRAAKDYHYVMVKMQHNGANEPTRYTTRMKGQKLVGLTSSAFSEFEENYYTIMQLRDAFSKQLALDAKIEKVENEYIIREKLKKKRMQDRLQRSLEKKMRKATKSELGWRKRFKTSALLEVQGNWERRRDQYTGMFFFHSLQPPRRPGTPHIDFGTGERFAESCQWEIPAEWDGDPLSADMTSKRQRVPDGPESALRARRNPGGAVSRMPQGIAAGRSVISDIQDEELDEYDTAPDRFAEEANRLHRPKNLPPELTEEAAFDQPAENWLPNDQGPSYRPPIATGNERRADGSVRANTTQSNRSRAPELLSVSSTKNGRRSVSGDSDLQSELDSVAADRSLAESEAPTIDTVNLEHIAEQLVSSDELMKVIAKRLGLSEDQVVPADELSSVFSVSSMGGDSEANDPEDGQNDRLDAPRDTWIDQLDEPEFDSDDDLWSDEEDEVGDFDEEKEIGLPEDMPQNQLEAAQLRRRELREARANRKSDVSVPDEVPALDLLPITMKNEVVEGAFISEDGETREEVYGWRRLPRPVFRSGFLTAALETHTKPPDNTSSNTLNSPVFLLPISPVDACKYVPESIVLPMESIFVPDVKKDMERSIATVERNIRREEELARNLPTDDLLLFGEAKEFTSADAYLARQMKEDNDMVRDPREEATEKSILAAKSSNIAMMEDALAEDIPVNTADQYGNSLLILAAQQGSKRMCKFLLRRGANINLQNLSGNTPLHYCYAYSAVALGEYLKKKGADDSIVNVDGLTCYEGLSRESMNEQYGDDDAAHLATGQDDSDDEDYDEEDDTYY